MRNDHGRAGVLVRAGACMLLGLAIATPAAAQFGGLKKKVKAATGQEAAAEGQKAAGVNQDQAAAPAAKNEAAGGGAVVLTPDVVDKLVAGLKARDGARQSALKENTSYTRYNQDAAAYKAAQAKCEAGKQSYPSRVAASEKMQARAQKFLDNVMAAQQKQDTVAMRVWGDSVAFLMDPACLAKEPTRPDDYYDAEREADSRAEKTAIKTSGLSAAEWAMGLERGQGILLGNAAPDVSASEKNAVNARAAELKPLLGIDAAPPARAEKAAPAPAPQPAAESPAVTVPAGTSAMNECMAKNAKKHEKEIVALGERAQAAQEAGDMARTLAIADSLRVLQMAGCEQGR